MASEIFYGLGGVIVTALGGGALFWQMKGGQTLKQAEWQVIRESLTQEQESLTQINANLLQKVSQLETSHQALSEERLSLQENLQLAEGQGHHWQQAIAILESSKQNLTLDLTKERDRLTSLNKQLVTIHQAKDKLQNDLQHEINQSHHQNEKLSLQLEQTQAELSTLNHKLKTSQEQGDRLQTELTDSQDRLTQHKSELDRLAQESDRQLTELQAQLATAKQEKEQAIAPLQAELTEFHHSQSQSAIALADAQIQIDYLKQQLQGNEQAIAQVKSELISQQQATLQAQTEKTKLEAQFKAEIEQLSQAKNQALTTLSEVNQTVSGLKTELVTLNQEAEQLQTLIQKGQQALSQLQQENSDLQGQIAILNQEKGDLTRQIKDLPQQLAAKSIKTSENAIIPEPPKSPSTPSPASNKEPVSPSSPPQHQTPKAANPKVMPIAETVIESDSHVKSGSSNLQEKKNVPSQSTDDNKDKELPKIKDLAPEIEATKLSISLETITPNSSIIPEVLTPEVPTPEVPTPEIPTPELTSKKSNPLQGKKLAILGTLTRLKRDQAKELIQLAGGFVSSSPTAQTDYIVLGKAPGDKLKKAQKLGLSQLTEAQLIQLLEESGQSISS